MDIQTLSKINITLQCISLVACGISLVLAILFSIKKDMKIMLLVAGMMTASIINGFGNLMGLIQIFIFPPQLVPDSYCNSEAFMEFFGLILFAVYQVLIDLSLYLNIYDWDKYERFMKYLMMKTQLISNFIVFILCTILLCFNQYGPTPPLEAINCWIESRDSLGISFTVIFEYILPTIAFIFDVFIVAKIIAFYKKYSVTQNERKKIVALILFPIVYGILGFTNVLFGFLHIQEDENSTNQITGLEATSYILVNIRGALLSLIFFNIIYQFYRDKNQNDGFILPPLTIRGSSQTSQMLLQTYSFNQTSD